MLHTQISNRVDYASHEGRTPYYGVPEYHTIVNELLKDVVFHSIEEVRTAVADAIDFYNNERPHMSLEWKTPAEAAFCTGELKKKWVSHRENFLKQHVA